MAAPTVGAPALNCEEAIITIHIYRESSASLAPASALQNTRRKKELEVEYSKRNM